jgi:membrane-associated phospholipid phosphatase
MFQTEIIHWLQSFSSGQLTNIMIWVSRTGYGDFYALCVICILAGMDFRKGLILSHVMILMVAVSEMLKVAIALPRPSEVDATVRMLETGGSNSSPFVKMGAPSFFSLPPGEVIAYARSLGEYSFGFPSGHCSSATTLWGSIALLFRNSFTLTLAFLVPVVMALSRMYLGRHFLADVLGGTIIGLIAVGLLAWGLAKTRLAEKVFPSHPANGYFDAVAFFRWTYLLVFPFALLLVPALDMRLSSALLGFNIGFLLVSHPGIPIDRGTFPKRLTRIGIAFIVFAGVYVTMGLLHAYLPTGQLIILAYARTTIAVALMIVVTVRAGARFGLYDGRSGPSFSNSTGNFQ